MNNLPNDKRDLKFGSAAAIQDPETLSLLSIPLDLSCVQETDITEKFLNYYHNWILSTKNNSIVGLEKFPYLCYSNGTTESFDKFYLANHTRRFRCFKGEYLYHKLAWRDHFSWAWLEYDDLKENDAVVISLPFSDLGNQHEGYTDLMEKCSNLKIPVLVDCAFFGICQNIKFNFDYPCITDITFSLSKQFPVAHARIGIRYSVYDTDDTLFVYKKTNYNNRIGSALGLLFIENFSPDFIVDKYKRKQEEYCQILDVVPSNSVLFGIGGDNWAEYNRGRNTNRLSFHRQYIDGLKNDSPKS